MYQNISKKFSNLLIPGVTVLVNTDGEEVTILKVGDTNVQKEGEGSTSKKL